MKDRDAGIRGDEGTRGRGDGEAREGEKKFGWAVARAVRLALPGGWQSRPSSLKFSLRLSVFAIDLIEKRAFAGERLKGERWKAAD